MRLDLSNLFNYNYNQNLLKMFEKCFCSNNVLLFKKNIVVAKQLCYVYLKNRDLQCIEYLCAR